MVFCASSLKALGRKLFEQRGAIVSVENSQDWGERKTASSKHCRVGKSLLGVCGPGPRLGLIG